MAVYGGQDLSEHLPVTVLLTVMIGSGIFRELFKCFICTTSLWMTRVYLGKLKLDRVVIAPFATPGKMLLLVESYPFLCMLYGSRLGFHPWGTGLYTVLSYLWYRPARSSGCPTLPLQLCPSIPARCCRVGVQAPLNQGVPFVLIIALVLQRPFFFLQ